MIDLLARFGLHCATAEDERVFADRFLLRTIAESQLFLFASALFVYAFFVWDRIIDPVHWGTTHMLRGLVIAPLMALCAASLFTAFGKRHFEAVILTALLVCQTGLAVVYAILDHGYDYAALGFSLALLGTTAMFPIRSRFLIIASFLTLVIVVTGHLLAANARPGWIVVNLMAVLCAIIFGTLSAYIRERGARAAYRTQKELNASRERVDDLLHSMLPREIVTRIQAGETAIADSHGEVSIIFADLVGFTELSRKISPAHLVKVLNTLFSTFDLEAERFAIDRIKTIGDAYMAIGGLTRAPGVRDHAENAAELAFAMQAAVQRLVDGMGYPVQIRIGLHVGPVVAGVIGVRRPAFDCWGESVNLANRLETRAEPGTILISESAYWRLRPAYEIEMHDDIDLKGIGTAKVYQLVGRKARRTADIDSLAEPVTSA
ncbi:MAG: adenylate/guanylate cyclase domain-containing protein [Sphingomonadaceae bacterium]|nr:adenylate/guanylate cyclase domain-containing protein [Sphingomonadaceae bacterium]